LSIDAQLRLFFYIMNSIKLIHRNTRLLKQQPKGDVAVSMCTKAMLVENICLEKYVLQLQQSLIII